MSLARYSDALATSSTVEKRPSAMVARNPGSGALARRALLSGADLANLCNEAALCATRRGATEVPGVGARGYTLQLLARETLDEVALRDLTRDLVR